MVALARKNEAPDSGSWTEQVGAIMDASKVIFPGSFRDVVFGDIGDFDTDGITILAGVHPEIPMISIAFRVDSPGGAMARSVIMSWGSMRFISAADDTLRLIVNSEENPTRERIRSLLDWLRDGGEIPR